MCVQRDGMGSGGWRHTHTRQNFKSILLKFFSSASASILLGVVTRHHVR